MVTTRSGPPRDRTRLIACLVGALLLCRAGAACAGEGAGLAPEEQCLPPWEFSRADSVEVCAPPPRPAAVRPERLAMSVLMRAYKGVISPVRGRSCGMSPSCSSYAREAIQSRGAVVGVMMACDRLLRCGNDPHLYRLVRDNERVLRRDPVDDACRSSE